MKKLDLTIIILSFNTKDFLHKCLFSIKKYEPNVAKIIVVDNNSTDGSLEYLEKLAKKEKNIEIVKLPQNIGFAAGNNQGIRRSKTKYILLLNSDTELKGSILEEMISWLEKKPKVGAVSCKLVFPDGTLQGTGGYFPTLLRVFSWMTIQDLPLVDSVIKPFHPLKVKSIIKNSSFYEKEQDLDWLTGAFFLFKKEISDTVGLIDDEYFMYTEDVDYCYRMKKNGWEIKYLPNWEIVHYGGGSSSREFSVLSEYIGVKKFFRKFYPSWQYPILRVFLKVGALWRIVVFGIIEGKQSVKIYKKAFITA